MLSTGEVTCLVAQVLHQGLWAHSGNIEGLQVRPKTLVARLVVEDVWLVVLVQDGLLLTLLFFVSLLLVNLVFFLLGLSKVVEEGVDLGDQVYEVAPGSLHVLIQLLPPRRRLLLFFSRRQGCSVVRLSIVPLVPFGFLLLLVELVVNDGENKQNGILFLPTLRVLL